MLARPRYQPKWPAMQQQRACRPPPRQSEVDADRDLRAGRCTSTGTCWRTPPRAHEEITADYSDLIYDLRRDRGAPLQGLHPQMAAQAPRHRRQSGGSRRAPVRFHPPAAEPLKERPHDKRDRAPARGVKRRIKTQTVLPSADIAAMLFGALLASGQINTCTVDGWQTLAASRRSAN